MMQGTGFYIWNLKDVLPIERMINALKRANATWVSIKVADGINKWNRIDLDGKWTGNDQGLLQIIAALKKEGIHVGGWQYIYPLPTLSPGAQAGIIGERVQKLGLQHLLIDAEHDAHVGAYWKWLADGTLNPERGKSANTYMIQIRGAGVPLSMPCALSSYRYPKYHKEFPFKNFVNDNSSNFIAQQLYWIGSHNPYYQLGESIRQYNELVRAGLPPLPFVPMGSAFKQGTWEPTAKDLEDFIQGAKDMGCTAWGFWSLDRHAIDRPEWLDAIAGKATTPPPAPPPPSTPDMVEIVGLEPDEELNVRANKPFGQVVYLTTNGMRYTVLGEMKDDLGRSWYNITHDPYRTTSPFWIASWYTEPV